MFATSLFPLPPPSTSLLPTLSQSQAENTQQQHPQHPHHPQSRRKPTGRLNTPLISLSHDERLIASRKLAIAMYGYSWLKPAGCNKTMLGRREEELEREEVERQMREVELQERMAIEQEEQERREELRRQAEAGEVEGVGERDLDEEVPEADDGSGEGEEDEEDEEDMDGNLDDDVPEADGQESSWVYDSRREPDTESENEDDTSDGANDSHIHRRRPHNTHVPRVARQPLTDSDDPAATEAMVNAMLDEDELGEYEHQHNLDEAPDMDRDLDADMEMDMDANLSDEVPGADDSPGWEHTDSELEESEMDISLLPPHPNSTSRNPGTTHEEMRRVSGNRMLPPPLPWPGQSQNHSREFPTSRQNPQQPQPRTAPRRNLRAMIQTPSTADEVSALISTGGTSAVDTGPLAVDGSVEARSPNRRSWLNPAGARRNLFGGLRGNNNTTSSTNASASTTAAGENPALQSRITASSGGLFTPSPRQNGGSDDEEEAAEQLRSRTRSGRLLGGLQVGRRARRAREGET